MVTASSALSLGQNGPVLMAAGLAKTALMASCGAAMPTPPNYIHMESRPGNRRSMGLRMKIRTHPGTAEVGARSGERRGGAISPCGGAA